MKKSVVKNTPGRVYQGEQPWQSWCVHFLPWLSPLIFFDTCRQLTASWRATRDIFAVTTLQFPLSKWCASWDPNGLRSADRRHSHFAERTRDASQLFMPASHECSYASLAAMAYLNVPISLHKRKTISGWTQANKFHYWGISPFEYRGPINWHTRFTRRNGLLFLDRCLWVPSYDVTEKVGQQKRKPN